VTEELRIMWKELLVVYKITVQHSAVGNEENRENLRIADMS
jgi:hypothetical protein